MNRLEAFIGQISGALAAIEIQVPHALGKPATDRHAALPRYSWRDAGGPGAPPKQWEGVQAKPIANRATGVVVRVHARDRDELQQLEDGLYRVLIEECGLWALNGHPTFGALEELANDHGFARDVTFAVWMPVSGVVRAVKKIETTEFTGSVTNALGEDPESFLPEE